MGLRNKIDSATRQAARHGLLIVIVAILALETTAILQYYYSQKVLLKEADRRAEGQLRATELQIMDVVDQVETAVRNSLWSVATQLDKSDSLCAVTTRLVSMNPVICGSAVAMTDKNEAPYSYLSDGRVLSTSLAYAAYDYSHQEWFVKPLETGDGYWSEPYFDEGGGNILMTTYSVPVTDARGRVKAVLTADVSLEWLTGLLENIEIYPGAFSMVVSRSGQIMVCPVDTLVMTRSVHELASSMEDSTTFQNMNKSLLSGETGRTTFQYEGKVHHVFFDSVQRTGWGMSISIPAEAIYGEVKRLGLMVTILQLLGLALLILILYHMIKSQRDLRQSQEQKSRLEGELHIARGIQMSMIPKIFPPYPERSEIDMYATVIPAKEVGGDFYDFYTRDDKLFFCIGDVSGKGVPASLVMAVTRSLFRTVSAHEKSPQRILGTMNQSMSDMNETNMFVTLFCGVLDLQTGHLRYGNAGHNAPVLVLPKGNEALPVKPNLPLGVLPDMVFAEQEAYLPSAAGLFLYTDGLTEAENPVHQLFGEDRMMDVLAAGLGSRQQIEAMTSAVESFVSEAPQSDDLTLLYIRFMNMHLTETTERHLVLHNDIQQIPQLAEFVEEVAEHAHLDVSLTMSLNLALEEAVTNVIMYAYPKGSDGLVDIEAIVRRKEIEFVVSDSGTPFDPTAAPEADTSLALEDRPIGGLGIFLVKKIMDVVKYKRSNDGKNILSMIKKLA